MKIFTRTAAFAGLTLFAFSAKAQWNTAGNTLTGTLPGTPTEWLGSTNSADLLIKTGGTEKMRVTSSGLVGIGGTPSEKLQVKSGNLLMDYWAGGTGNLYFGGKTDAGSNGLRLSYNNNGNGYIDVRTTTSNGLVFRLDAVWASTERFRINQDGNVSIGVSSPLAKFHVNGSALFSNITTSPTSAAYIRGNSAYSTATTPDYTWWNNDQTGFFHPANNVIGFAINGTEKMRITSTGQVGIGTSTPIQNFEVNGAMKLAGGIQKGGTSAIPTADLGLYSLDPYTWMRFVTNNQPMKFYTDGGTNPIGATERLSIESDGKVLIGTTSMSGFMGLPGSYLLYVQQGILTEKVKVALANSSSWADYVFEEDYKMMDIDQLESYVNTNKHLPGVPSAEEVSKNGIDVATMDAKLLEKIEELSLYIIEQNKRITDLEKKLGKK
jgi:hypothetical protein